MPLTDLRHWHARLHGTLQLMMELATLFKSDCEALVDFHGATYREGQVAVILEFMVSGRARPTQQRQHRNRPHVEGGPVAASN